MTRSPGDSSANVNLGSARSEHRDVSQPQRFPIHRLFLHFAAAINTLVTASGASMLEGSQIHRALVRIKMLLALQFPRRGVRKVMALCCHEGPEKEGHRGTLDVPASVSPSSPDT